MLSNGNRSAAHGKRGGFLSISPLIFSTGVIAMVLVTLKVMETLAIDASGGRSIANLTTATAATTANATSIHDLSLVAIDARMTLQVTAQGASETRVVSVEIQNRGNHDEKINEETHLGNGLTSGLIRLKVVVIDDDEGCEPAKVAIRPRAPLAGGPRFLLKPKDGYGILFDVTFRCTAAKPQNRKDPTPGDYTISATVHHEVLDGNPDSDPSDDICPRQPVPPKRDIQDKGCGWKLRGQPFGPNVTDVVLKPAKKP